VWLLVIIVVVLFVSGGVLVSRKGRLHPDSKMLEQTWTLLPMLVLLTIALPRVRLLCLQDALGQGLGARFKLVRNQWSWQREWEDRFDHLLDSERRDRVSAYDTPVVLERAEVVRLLVTRTDVLHSIGIPALGVKLDSVPGRLNRTSLEIGCPGVFLGACYELCGSGHRVMPITMLVY
jgi:cytochrome c oxidase subunit 2